MEKWSYFTKKTAYILTMVLTILFPLSEFVVILITMIMGLSAFEESSGSATGYFNIMAMFSSDAVQNQEMMNTVKTIFIIVCVLSLLFRLALLVVTILRHFLENAFFKLCPIIVYIISVFGGFYIISGMRFSTLSSKFPVPVIGWVTIPPEAGGFIIIGFIISIVMAILSYINVRAKSFLS